MKSFTSSLDHLGQVLPSPVTRNLWIQKTLAISLNIHVLDYNFWRYRFFVGDAGIYNVKSMHKHAFMNISNNYVIVNKKNVITS